jgi:hypothetical protein
MDSGREVDIKVEMKKFLQFYHNSLFVIPLSDTEAESVIEYYYTKL